MSKSGRCGRSSELSRADLARVVGWRGGTQYKWAIKVHRTVPLLSTRTWINEHRRRRPFFIDPPLLTCAAFTNPRLPRLVLVSFHRLALSFFPPFNTQCSNATYVRGPAACMCACRTKCMMWIRAATSIREHLYRTKIRWRLTWWSPTFSLYLFFSAANCGGFFL